MTHSLKQIQEEYVNQQSEEYMTDIESDFIVPFRFKRIYKIVHFQIIVTENLELISSESVLPYMTFEDEMYMKLPNKFFRKQTNLINSEHGRYYLFDASNLDLNTINFLREENGRSPLMWFDFEDEEYIPDRLMKIKENLLDGNILY